MKRPAVGWRGASGNIIKKRSDRSAAAVAPQAALATHADALAEQWLWP